MRSNFADVLAAVEVKEKELAHEHHIRQRKLEHAKEITKLRQEFEMNAKELQQKYEKKMRLLRDDLELRRKQEVHEIQVSLQADRRKGRTPCECGRLVDSL